jgi:flagellar biosynthesis protein FlhA
LEQDKVISRDLVLANSNIMSAVAVLVILALMVIPVSPVLLDVLMTFSIAMAVLVMLVSLYLREPLQFSTFPSLLLVMTLFRLALNVASTRLILSRGQAGEYVIKLKGVPISRAQLRPGQLLAMSTRPDAGAIAGTPTTEPAFSLPAVWIDADHRRMAESEGYTVVEAPAVLATHLSETIRSHADELLSRQDVRDMLETVRDFAPALVEELIPDKVPVTTLHNVLRSLLHERVPVRDIVTILETVANHVGHHAGSDYLTSKVREALHRTISQLYTEADGAIHVVSLHPAAEQVILDASRQSEQTGQVVLDPRFTQEFLGRLDATLRAAYGKGAPPVLLVPTPVRFFVKRLVEPSYPNLAVMGYTEVSPSVRIQSVGTVVTHGYAQQQEQHAGA